MRNFFIFLFSIIIGHAYSQNITISIVENNTNTPISNAFVHYKNESEGAITNSEGKIIIPVKNDSLIVESINYDRRSFSKNEIEKKYILYLNPKYKEIEEVTIFPKNYLSTLLDKIIGKVLDNYVDTSYRSSGIMREKILLDNQLNTLTEINFTLWQKNSNYIVNHDLEKNLDFHIDNVKYSKKMKIENVYGGVVLKNYLNHFSIVDNLNDIKTNIDKFHISSIKKNTTHTFVKIVSSEINIENSNNANYTSVINLVFDKNQTKIYSINVEDTYHNYEFSGRIICCSTKTVQFFRMI